MSRTFNANLLHIGLGQNIPFSDAVQEAFRLGYTEPDPRDDLGDFLAIVLMIFCQAADGVIIGALTYLQGVWMWRAKLSSWHVYAASNWR